MRKRLALSTILLLAAGLALLFGCKRGEEKVIAIVGEKTITAVDLDRRITQITKGLPNESISPQAIRGILDDLIDRLLILTYAESLGVTVGENELDEYLENLNIPPSEEYSRETAREDLIITKIVEQEVAGKISDDELEAVTITPRESPSGTLYTFREITVKTEEEASQLLEELQGGESDEETEEIKWGADFAILAKERSISASRNNGGLVGPVPGDDLPEKFSETLTTLEPDQISKVVQTEFGFHIFLLISRSKPSEGEWSKTLDLERFRVAYKANYEKWLKLLKETIYINVDQDSLKEFIAKYQQN